MKNNIITIALFALLCTGMISCSAFLDEDAKGLLTPDNFFKNQDEANLALNGLQAGVGASGLVQHNGTDIGVVGRFAIAGGWQIAVYNYDVSSAQVRNAWSNAYAQVRNANLVLAGAERSELSEQVKGQTIGMAQFYRAYQYLRLITEFGDVPFWLDEVNIDEVSLLGKTDADEIGAVMIADLESAISSGYLPTGRWNDNDGRPTVWAARMLKAYYHVWRNEWAEARVELLEITANSPHALNADYAHMYREGNELSDELIFGRQFLLGTLNNRTFEQAHYNANAENGPTRTAMNETGTFARSSAMTLRKSFADTYDMNDARRVYNVWDKHTLADGSEAVFNFIYIPKLMRAALPLSDPLMQNPDPRGTSSEPARIFRISDAFLLLAEAEFMLGGSSPQALSAINAVRARTTLPDYTSITMEDIRNERGWEMVAEGFWGRKYDLIRWGILESTVMALPAAEADAGAYSLAVERAQDEANFISAAPNGKFQQYPIPLDEILKSNDIGGALTQNPLWE